MIRTCLWMPLQDFLPWHFHKMGFSIRAWGSIRLRNNGGPLNIRPLLLVVIPLVWSRESCCCISLEAHHFPHESREKKQPIASTSVPLHWASQCLLHLNCLSLSIFLQKGLLGITLPNDKMEAPFVKHVPWSATCFLFPWKVCFRLHRLQTLLSDLIFPLHRHLQQWDASNLPIFATLPIFQQQLLKKVNIPSN